MSEFCRWCGWLIEQFDVNGNPTWFHPTSGHVFCRTDIELPGPLEVEELSGRTRAQPMPTICECGIPVERENRWCILSPHPTP